MDELLGRQVPHSQTAEQAVLGSMLIDRACIADVSAKLGAEDFYFEKNREIFETIYNMYAYGKEVDAVTVLDRMKVLGIYDAESTERYIMELMRVTPTAANVMEYVRIIVERALMRRILGTANEISEMVYGGYGNADFMLESAEQKVYALRKDRTVGGLLPISRVIRTVVDELDVLGREGGGIPGVKTGLTDIDEKILGLNPGDFILIASRPGMGKTSMALNMAVSAAKSSNKTVAVFSLEMTREQLVKRVLSGQAMVEGTKLSKGNLSSEDWRRLSTAAISLSQDNVDIRIDDNSALTVADMNAQCRRLSNLGLVVIDYIQLMQSAGSKNTWANESRTQAVSEISRSIKIMAKELGVPVIALSQLSRANEARQNKRPVLSDIRESGAIEQDADVVIGLYREGYYDHEAVNPNEAEAIILKNRRGETGTVNLLWMPEYTSFVNAEKWRDEL
jgi:replicative DNA helicase